MAYNDFNMDNHWLPFTPNRHFRKDPRVFVAADGMNFTTHDGKKVIDGISSLWCVGAGHNRKPINEAIKKQLDTLDYATAFQARNDQAFKAAEMIAGDGARRPEQGAVLQLRFGSGGHLAEGGAGLPPRPRRRPPQRLHRPREGLSRRRLRRHERRRHPGQPQGVRHARCCRAWTTCASSTTRRTTPTSTTRSRCGRRTSLAELENRILPLHDPSNVAAIIVEPVAGSAGWYLPPKGYLKRLREICDKHGILLIFDEVITGFGRMGTNFARRLLRRRAGHAELRQVRHQRRDPAGRRDLPRQALRRDDEDRRARARRRVLPRLHLFGPPGRLRRRDRDAATCTRRKACSRAPARWARCWATPSTRTFKGLPNVIGIRSLGLAAAVELAPIAGTPGKRAYDIFLDCFKKGALVRPAGDVLVIAPPYIVEKSHIDTLVNTLADSIKRNA